MSRKLRPRQSKREPRAENGRSVYEERAIVSFRLDQKEGLLNHALQRSYAANRGVFNHIVNQALAMYREQTGWEPPHDLIAQIKQELEQRIAAASIAGNGGSSPEPPPPAPKQRRERPATPPAKPARLSDTPDDVEFTM